MIDVYRRVYDFACRNTCGLSKVRASAAKHLTMLMLFKFKSLDLNLNMYVCESLWVLYCSVTVSSAEELLKRRGVIKWSTICRCGGLFWAIPAFAHEPGETAENLGWNS